MAPTLAARRIATLDHVTGGRIALHVITGGADSEQRRDGDFLDHDTRYRRTDEYVDVLRRVWTSPVPFDYEGEFYRFERAYSDVKPVQQPHVPVYFGGSSGPAGEVAAKHCDVYATWGQPLAAVKARIAEVKSLAVRHGRNPGISISFRPIVAPTEDAAWQRAHDILASIQSKGPGGGAGPTRGQSVGARRLVEFAEQGEVHDKRLWMAIAGAVGGSGNSSALVGTPAQVADALMDYYDLGVTTFLIRGFDPMNDAIEYGRELIPAIREGVKQRQAIKARVSVT